MLRPITEEEFMHCKPGDTIYHKKQGYQPETKFIVIENTYDTGMKHAGLSLSNGIFTNRWEDYLIEEDEEKARECLVTTVFNLTLREVMTGVETLVKELLFQKCEEIKKDYQSKSNEAEAIILSLNANKNNLDTKLAKTEIELKELNRRPLVRFSNLLKKLRAEIAKRVPKLF